jgi:hypothetical protein
MVKQERIVAISGIFAIVTVVAVLLGAALAAGPTLAAKGGNGNGGHKTATLTVSPNPVSTGTAFTVNGSGFRRDRPVVMAIPGYFPYDTVVADRSGAFSYTYSRPLDPGTHPVLAYQERGKKMELKASTWVTVTP